MSEGVVAGVSPSMKRTHPQARSPIVLALTGAVLFVVTLFPTPVSAGEPFITAGKAIPPACSKTGRSGQMYHWKPGC